MNVSLSYYSSIGYRKNNEDAVSVMENEHGLLAIVADGLGGQDNGEYASRQAVKTLHDLLCTEDVSASALEKAIVQANEDICSLQKSRPGAQTTIAAVWLGEGLPRRCMSAIQESISSETTQFFISQSITALPSSV